MNTELAAPIRLRPRLDPKPWGGQKLRRFDPSRTGRLPIGEAVATAAESVATEGALAEKTLAELVGMDPGGLVGRRGLAATGGRPLFPLLAKLIDAAENLSIQVHPDDAAAAPLDRLGKTEAYHVLEAAPGAVIGLGLRDGVTVEEFIAGCRAGSGAATTMVRWVPAVPGTTFLIPAGTVHALGGGCLVYEIQQPSDVTYRFDDGERVDTDGKPRALHVDQGAAVLRPGYRPEPITPIRLRGDVGRRDLLAACDVFGLERIGLETGATVSVVSVDGPQVITCLEGTVDVATDAGSVTVGAGWTAVTGSSLETTIRAVAPAVLLRAWVPDLERDVVLPARAAGAELATVAALSGPLPDLARILGR